MACVQSQSELNARQRKHVYMHSTIFDPEGPSPNSVYAPGRQADIYKTVKQSSRRGAPQHSPSMELPSPADIKCTQLRGSGCVQQSGCHHKQRWDAMAPSGYPSARSPRQTDRQAIVNDGEVIPVVQASKSQEHIPKEFWATSVKLQWHDTRNEMSRPKNGNGVARQNVPHHTMKRQELSSELFGKERQFGCSTEKPRKELMHVSADLIEFDSALDPKVRADRGPGDHQRLHARSAAERMKDNLTHSEHHPLAHHNWREEQPENVSKADEDPTYLERRRGERNFSDMFGTKMGERRDTRGQREEVNATRTCSFLDPRSEIGNRNKGKWRVEEQHPSKRKEAEVHNSRLFGYEENSRAVTQRPEHNETHHLERSCWDTKDIMNTGSEIARRRRLKQFESDERHTHTDRKLDDLSSSQVRMGTGAPPIVAPHAPRSARSPGVGRLEGRITAKENRHSLPASSGT